MQFAVNLLNCGGIAELLVLGAATIAISALSAVPLKAAESPNPTVNPLAEPSHALAKQACWSIALVMILACLFSTLDNVVTLSNATAGFSITTAMATGLIQTDDTSLFIAGSSANRFEGNFGSTAFTFTVTGPEMVAPFKAVTAVARVV